MNTRRPPQVSTVHTRFVLTFPPFETHADSESARLGMAGGKRTNKTSSCSGLGSRRSLTEEGFFHTESVKPVLSLRLVPRPSQRFLLKEARCEGKLLP